MLIGARRAVLGARPWWLASAWLSSAADRPAVIIDHNRGRYALPALGPELIPDPELDTAGLWTAGTGWTVSGGVATKTAGTGSYLALTGSTVVIGAVYCITYTVATRTAGATVPSIGNVDGSTASAAAGTYTNYVVAAATTTTGGAGLNIYANSAFAGTISRVSVQQVQLGASLTSPTLRAGVFSDLLSVSATRSGTASTYVDTDGVLKSLATSDVPRFTTLDGRRRLVVESASTNLLTRSNDFADGVWAKAWSTITTDGTLAPDGTVATKLIWDNGGIGYLSQGTYSFTSGVPVTISAFFKYAGRAQFYLLITNAIFGGTGANATVTCDVQAGTVSAGSRSEVYGSVQNYGGGWYRFTMTVAPTATAAASVQFGRPLTNGDGVVGVYPFGAQIEANAFATSYIPTAASTITRAAELVTGSALVSALHRRAAGTNVTQYLQLEDPTVVASLQQLWTVGGDSGNSRLGVRKTQNGSVEGPRAVVGNGSSVTTHAPGSSAGANPGETVRAVLAWDATNSRMALKGALVGSDGNAWDATSNPASTFQLVDVTTYKSSNLVDLIVLYSTRVSNAALPGLSVVT